MASQSDRANIVNPLSSIDDRFALKNKNIQKAMVENTVKWRGDAQNLRDQIFREMHSSTEVLDLHNEIQRLKLKINKRKVDRPIQNFYMNPKYKGKGFSIPPK